MSQATPVTTTSRTVALVAYASGDFVNLFAGEETCYVATEDDELGRWALECVFDEKNEAVPMASAGAQNVWMRAASRLAAAYLPSGEEDDGVPKVAVHVVCRVQRRDADGTFVAVVWPPKGPPRNAKTEAELGRIIREVANDDSQPKVPAAGPPDAGRDFLDRVSRGIAALSSSDGG